MTNQGDRQASVRALTGTAFDYNGDWSALFDQEGYSSASFNERFLAWLNGRLGTTYSNLSCAMQAFAEANGFFNWDAVNFIPSAFASFFLLEDGSGVILLEDGTSQLELER